MSKTTNTLLAFAVGAGVGAALGILFAPDTGANTRDKLSFKLSKYKKELEDLINELVDGKEIHLNEAKTEGKRVISEAKNKAEEARISIRNIRRNAKDALDKSKKDGDVSEDDVKRAEKALDEITNKGVHGIDDVLKHKESELLEV